MDSLQEMRIRQAFPSDYDAIMEVVDFWWGREVMRALPRLFLDLFADSSWVAEDRQGLAGFIVAILPSDLGRGAYVHFVGVRPDQRRQGLARSLYDIVQHEACARGYQRIAAITPPINEDSVRFHESLGFTTTHAVPDYNGPGQVRTVFSKTLTP